MKQHEPKNVKKYCCEICDFNTSNKTDLTKHNSTHKHKNCENETLLKQNETISLKKTQKYTCNCGIILYSRTTLWRHKKKCLINNVNPIEEPIQHALYNKELMLMLIKQNAELLEIVKNITNQK
jgi:hypothetical protein